MMHSKGCDSRNIILFFMNKPTVFWSFIAGIILAGIIAFNQMPKLEDPAVAPFLLINHTNQRPFFLEFISNAPANALCPTRHYDNLFLKVV